jgi:hypothetical protein
LTKTQEEYTPYNSAVRITASAFGALAGITGIISGYYEIQQGNVPTSSLWTSFIGPAYGMYENNAYSVVTVVPNFYLTGILALLISSIALVWSVRYIHRKNGAKVMLLLAIAQTLVGGGWVLDLGLFTSLLATRIHSPLNWWRRYLPKRAVRILAQLYPWAVLSFSILSIMLLGYTLLGFNNEVIVSMVTPIAATMIIPAPLMIISGIAHDIQLTHKLLPDARASPILLLTAQHA